VHVFDLSLGMKLMTLPRWSIHTSAAIEEIEGFSDYSKFLVFIV